MRGALRPVSNEEFNKDLGWRWPHDKVALQIAAFSKEYSSLADAAEGGGSSPAPSPSPSKQTSPSPSKLTPPSNSRQLNAWLDTLNDADFAEAMNSPSHDFTAECHPYEAAVLRNAKNIIWKRSLPSPASTPSQATADSDDEAAYFVSFSGREADAAFCSQLNNHMYKRAGGRLKE